MSLVLLIQFICCRPFCPMPQRHSLKGMDFQGALLICVLMLTLSYIVVYGDHYMWFDSLHMRILLGIAIALAGILLYRMRYYRYPYVEFKLFGIAFLSIALYGMLMYFTLGTGVNIEQYRLAIFLRGFSYAILGPTLMWALEESVPSLELFFMGLFVFNIFHMYLAGATGYGIYTTIFSHFMNDDMANYGRQLTLTHLDLSHFNFGEYVGNDFLHSMMLVAMKQVYGYVIWFALAIAAIFLLCDIPAVRTNIRKVPRWSVYAIEYLAGKK